MKPNKSLKNAAIVIAYLCVCFLANAQSTTPKWARTWNSSGTQTDQGYAVAVGSNGNVYVTGIANSGAFTDSWIETRCYNGSGTLQWTTSYNGGSCSCQAGRENGIAIAVDGSGNIWVAGSTYNGTTNYSDLTLIKYNSSGVIQTNYPKRYADASGSSNWVRGTALAVYNATNVYIAGSTNSGAGWKLIVLKDDPSGSGWGWSNTPYTYQGTTTTSGEAADLKINSNNTSLYVTGIISNTGQNIDVVTAQLNPSTGAQVWATQYNNSSQNLDDFAMAMGFDQNGNVYVAGSTATSSQGQNGLLLKYNSSGVLQSGYPITYNSANNYDDQWSDIALAPGGGNANGTVVVGGRTVVSPLAATRNENYLLAAYSVSTAALWSNWSTNPVIYDGSLSAPEPAGTDQGWAIDYEPTTNRIYITGRSAETGGNVNITTLGYDEGNGSLVWGPASYDYNLDSYVGPDMMAFKYQLVTKFNAGYCVDDIYIAGQSYVAGNDVDYLALKYSCGVCVGCARYAMEGADQHVSEAYDLFPNPFSTAATLRLKDGREVSDASFYVYDINGREVRVLNKLSGNVINIDRDKLNAGIYFYKFVSDGEIIVSGKFILQD